MLSDSGLSVIEATSFVSPKWVPQVIFLAYLFGKVNANDYIYVTKRVLHQVDACVWLNP